MPLLEYPFSLDPLLWHESPDSMNSISSDRRLEINHDPIRGTHEANLWLSKRAGLPPSIPAHLPLRDSRASALSLILTGRTRWWRWREEPFTLVTPPLAPHP